MTWVKYGVGGNLLTLRVTIEMERFGFSTGAEAPVVMFPVCVGSVGFLNVC